MKLTKSTVTVRQLAEDRLSVNSASVNPESPSTTVRSSMDKVAGGLAVNTTGADVARAPTLSTATAVSTCSPGGTSIHTHSNGASQSAPNTLVPSKNSTRLIRPSVSVAVADSARFDGSVKHGATAASSTVGGMLVTSELMIVAAAMLLHNVAFVGPKKTT